MSAPMPAICPTTIHAGAILRSVKKAASSRRSSTFVEAKATIAASAVETTFMPLAALRLARPCLPPARDSSRRSLLPLPSPRNRKGWPNRRLGAARGHRRVRMDATGRANPVHARRFHLPHAHLDSVFGGDWFGLKAEAFARFFGTPTFLIAQTFIVAIWILVNIIGWTQFDVYPFILLNLAFSTQAAYAAPLILLAQTRQADRDKAMSMADAQHREALARAAEERQTLAA